MYLFSDGASCCHCTPVVGTGAWVPLGYLLPILPPLASIIHLINNPKHICMFSYLISVYHSLLQYIHMKQALHLSQMEYYVYVPLVHHTLPLQTPLPSWPVAVGLCHPQAPCRRSSFFCVLLGSHC